MILNSWLGQQHIPSIYYDQFFPRKFRHSHILTQLTHPPKALQLTHRPIGIHQIISNLINTLIQLIKNTLFYILDGGVDVAILFV